MSVSLAPSLASPAPLGTPVTWTASVSGADPGTLWYRFRVGIAGVGTPRNQEPQLYRTIVDYGPNPTFSWSTIAREGRYEIEAAVENTVTGETTAAVQPFTLSPLALGAPVITPTAHPLVFIYSAPPCRGSMRVEFTGPDGALQSTPFHSCDDRLTMNFYLAGMRPNASYMVQHEILNGSQDSMGAALSLTTPGVNFQMPAMTLLTAPAPPAGGGVLLHDPINTNVFATDLDGNLIWYVPFPLTVLTNAAPGGSFLGSVEDGTQDPSRQIFREFDLTGATLAETNAARVSQQLAALGMHAVNSFHHDAIKLPNGNYLLLAGSERIMTDVQGPGPVDILGDTILVLDPNLQVLWAWDAFDHLDPHRSAILGETCKWPGTPSCSAFYLATTANDWLHGNGLQLTPDGDILYSIRHQDWVVKIDYRNGAGTGDILWRLGVGGDFEIDSTNPYPWFSHQHDPNFLADGRTLLVFDNGNTRISANPGEHSRAQLYQINEEDLTATPVINADLGVNSAALGTAEALPDGNYHFDAGFIAPAASGSLYTQLYELDSAGEIVWTLQVNAQEYRNLRLNDLYSAPVAWVP